MSRMTILQVYRTAIYLNNAGIALLKTHSYVEAKEVLLDAISTIKFTQVQCTNSPPRDSSLMERFGLQDKIAKADRYLCMRPKNASVHRNDATIWVQIVSDNALSADYLLAFDDYLPQDPHTCVYPIRIDSAAFSSDMPNAYDLKLASTVLLYNCAIAYHMKSSTTSSFCLLVTPTQFNNAAYQLLHSSYSIASTLCVAGDEEGIWLGKLVAFASFNLKHLVRVGRILGIDYFYKEEYNQRLAYYQVFLWNESKLFQHIPFPPAA